MTKLWDLLHLAESLDEKAKGGDQKAGKTRDVILDALEDELVEEAKQLIEEAKQKGEKAKRWR